MVPPHMGILCSHKKERGCYLGTDFPGILSEKSPDAVGCIKYAAFPINKSESKKTAEFLSLYRDSGEGRRGW